MEITAPADILMITQWYRPELIGISKYSSEMAEFFSSHGSGVSVLTSRPSYPRNEVFPEYRDGSLDQEVLDGVEVLRLPTLVSRGGGVLARVVAEINFFMRGLFALGARRVRRKSTVISFCPSALSVLLGWFATPKGGRHVAMVYDIQSGLAAGLGMVQSDLVLRIIRFVECFCINRANHAVVLSEEMASALSRGGVDRPISVLPIWVDPEIIYPLPRSEGAPPTLLYNGNLGRKQGLGQLLDLAVILNESRPDIRILIRGGGFQEAALKKDAERRGLNNVRFESLLPEQDLNLGLSQGDVHLVPQDPEAADFAVPSKIYNIMAAGRPFVATANRGSTLWNLAEKSGAFRCRPPGDAEAFAQEVVKLIDNPDLGGRLGEQGRTYVLKFSAKDHVLGSLRKILREG